MTQGYNKSNANKHVNVLTQICSMNILKKLLYTDSFCKLLSVEAELIFIAYIKIQVEFKAEGDGTNEKRLLNTSAHLESRNAGPPIPPLQTLNYTELIIIILN